MKKSIYDPLTDVQIDVLYSDGKGFERYMKRKGLNESSAKLAGCFRHLEQKETESDLFVIWINSNLTDRCLLSSTIAHEILHLVIDLQRYMYEADGDDDSHDVTITDSNEEHICYHFDALFEKVHRIVLDTLESGKIKNATIEA